MSIQCQKIWIEQCEAAEGIRENFGLQNALDYLLGEKLFTFLLASEQDEAFAAEIPAFIEEIRCLFTSEEIRGYLTAWNKRNSSLHRIPTSRRTIWTKTSKKSFGRAIRSPALKSYCASHVSAISCINYCLL